MILYRYSNNPYDTTRPKNCINSSTLFASVYLHEFTVISETKCGVWIGVGYEQKRKFINTNAVRQYAYKNEEDARKNFIARKKRQIKILTTQIENAQWSLDVIDQNEPLTEHSPYKFG